MQPLSAASIHTHMDLEYQETGLGHKPALIVVDMINGFTDPSCPLGYECPKVIQANKQLLSVFRKMNLPIYFTTVVYHNEQQARVFRDRIPALNVLTPDSRWVEVDPAMNRRSGEILIEKQWASGFHNTDLNQLLSLAEVDSLVITGLTTSGCVRATAVDGLQYNYTVTVASDAVGDRNEEAHHANLYDLQAKYADVKTSDTIISQLEQIKQD